MENKDKRLRLLIDTNIIMDVLLERQPFFEDSRKVLDLCKSNNVRGCVAMHTIPTLWYLFKRSTTEENCRKIMQDLLSYLEVSNLNKRLILEALSREDFSDFEDCLQDQCALNFQADYIVTRNKKDFELSKVPAYLPAELLEFAAV